MRARYVAFLVLLVWLDQGTICVVHFESLAYPDVAWATQIQGDVQVHVDISTKGEVASASAVSGHPALKAAAEANAKKWRFGPGPQRESDIFYEFKLQEPKTDYKPETKNLYDSPDHVQIISSIRNATH